ncbi:hypothetical protein C7212DRAFT_342386 [Tuber magnatum]|uniref:Uncharacterized protein n=1 Tax=Tuber magnatum TaxID=42249 RepID=A0A317SX32_9PEZI|nr:hypothetical protein C7212DRAFT_342386 [Tuber magnatum]
MFWIWTGSGRNNLFLVRFLGNARVEWSGIISRYAYSVPNGREANGKRGGATDGTLRTLLRGRQYLVDFIRPDREWMCTLPRRIGTDGAVPEPVRARQCARKGTGTGPGPIRTSPIRRSKIEVMLPSKTGMKVGPGGGEENTNALGTVVLLRGIEGPCGLVSSLRLLVTIRLRGPVAHNFIPKAFIRGTIRVYGTVEYLSNPLNFRVRLINYHL